eukprot:g9633.t1
MLGEVPLEPGLQPKPGLQALMLQRLDVRLALAPQQPDVQLAPLCSWGAAGHMTGLLPDRGPQHHALAADRLIEACDNGQK